MSQGNEEADRLAKEGGQLPQENLHVSYSETKTIIHANFNTKWMDTHPKYNASDAYYQLSRGEQRTILRLRTGHNRMSSHMYRKFGIGKDGMCTCGLAEMNTEHVLQHCHLKADLRAQTWPTPTSLEQKLYGGLEHLTMTARFVLESEVVI